MKSLISILFLTLCGCTYNISMSHSEGYANDLIDTEQSPTNDIKPSLEIPVKAI